jgi:hypothetical protein
MNRLLLLDLLQLVVPVQPQALLLLLWQHVPG